MANDKNIHNHEEYDPVSQSLSDALTTGLTMLKFFMLAAIAVFFLLGIFKVDTGTSVLVRRFGEYITDSDGNTVIYEPGKLYYAIPLIDKVEVIDKRAREINIDVEFTPAKGGAAEQMNQNTPEKLMPGKDGYAISGDMNIIHCIWQINYRVKDAYLFQTSVQEKETEKFNKQTGKKIFRSGPEQMLIESFLNAVIRVTAGTDIDSSLKGDRLYVERIKETVSRKLALFDCGLEITGIQLINSVPPQKTSAAFTDVINARTELHKKISSAEGKKREILNTAKGNAKEITDSAEVYKQRIISSARSDADNIKELLVKFPNDSKGLNIYLQQFHSEVIAEVLENSKAFVIRPGSTWYISKQLPYKMKKSK